VKYLKGNLLESEAQVLVNTVNTVGVMGKGIALQFKNKFPTNYKIYSTACKNKEVITGKLLVVKENTLEGEKIIINFPTKTEWFKKSTYAYIEEGLIDLVKVIEEFKIQSIAIPPLGCGNGGLNWDKVKALIEKYLGKLTQVDIQIFEPNEEIKEILKREDSNKEVKLTPTKAMVLYAMFYYESLGENSSLFVANKLAYFLQRLGEKSLKFKFKASHYGPYSSQVAHVLLNLNGKYLKGLEQMNVKAFEPLELQYDRLKELSKYVRTELSAEQRIRLSNLVKLIDGFQSALALEILATVDFVKKDKPDMGKDEIISKIQNWSDRKSQLFQEKHITIAINHLDKYSKQFQIG